MNRCVRWYVFLLIAGGGLFVPSAAGEEITKRYPLTYPVAEQFCPPVDGFFDEVQRTMDRARGRTFRHQPNGGYGLPIVDKVGGVNLLHLGADVGWYRVGEPVFAVANGIVRLSQGPVHFEKDKKTGKQPKVLEWGNHIVIEHKLADEKYAATVYGRLANERWVKGGEVVSAGQQIGSIGPTNVNGGYKPHLHLGVRDGRMAEVGRKLLLMSLSGKPTVLEIAELREDVMVVKSSDELPEEVSMGLDGRKFAIRKVDGKAEIDLAFLYYVPAPDFLIVGYGLSTEGWRDPISFLQINRADTNPAVFTRAPRERAARTA